MVRQALVGGLFGAGELYVNFMQIDLFTSQVTAVLTQTALDALVDLLKLLGSKCSPACVRSWSPALAS